MFAVNSTIQAYLFSKEKNEVSACREIANGCTLLLDVGMIVLATMATLSIVKIFPKDFLTKNRMVALQATALTAGFLDLLALIHLCYSKTTPKNEPYCDQRNTVASTNVQPEAPPNNDRIVHPSIVDIWFRDSISDYPALFNKGFDTVYDLFFTAENNPLALAQTYELSPQQMQEYQTRRDKAYADLMADRQYVFDHIRQQEIVPHGCKAAYRVLFNSVYQKTLELMRQRVGLQEDPFSSINDEAFSASYEKAYDKSFKSYEDTCKAAHLERNEQCPEKRFIGIHMGRFYYDPKSVRSIAQDICIDAKTSAESQFTANAVQG